MKEPLVQSIFPTTVMFSDLDREFTEEEMSFVEKHSKKSYTAVGNDITLNNYILDEPEFVNLKKEVTEFVNVYFQKVFKPAYPAKVYITQSWISYTKKGQFHHRHKHSNSFISGTLYINADVNKDKIYFYKPDYHELSIFSTEFDMHNAPSWWFPVGTGHILAFPSSLLHDVETVTSEKTRICLAFNTFVKGVFGDRENLTELKID